MRLSKKVVKPLCKILEWPLYGLYCLWCGTLQYNAINRQSVDSRIDAGLPVILCLWHDELFPLIYFRGKLKIITVVSKSKDGDILANVIQRIGLETARGSSSRGGSEALRNVIKRMKDGFCACITVDGPKGPRHKVKKGVIFLAQQTNAPIVPIRIFMEKSKKISSWDRFQLPIPFSKIHVICGDAYYVSPSLTTQEELTDQCRLLEERLNNLRL
ncbi:hypothetical protein BW722_04705 [Lawsonia intracellularis]|uniref:lysophospholipid acyltransferase family protein n=1 Tax=Lawsonia intracellularis TaxID=29546 RepID=UPI0009773719|nr:lysophospholipid acyltransferase family protein [Lawsonia intracellularis]OMQ03010.1 hypothetical protein BW722_04705 [Lawsonia intracellularis]